LGSCARSQRRRRRGEGEAGRRRRWAADFKSGGSRQDCCGSARALGESESGEQESFVSELVQTNLKVGATVKTDCADCFSGLPLIVRCSSFVEGWF
jgi:hypothetical protein